MKITVLIVDDEAKSLEVTRMMLGEFKSMIERVFTASNIDEAYQIIIENTPDLVLLDVELTSKTGFDLLKRFNEPTFKTVFVTAHDKYAFNAIKADAVDYILKPIDIDDLQKALNKTIRMLQLPSERSVLKLKPNANLAKNKIIIPTQKELLLVELNNIMFCKAEGGYTAIYLNSNEIVLSSKDLKTYQGMLDDRLFFRIHDSYLVNYNYIKSILNDNYVQLIDGNNIPLSRRRRTEFLNWIRSI
ncbi:LytR/AlgR family response regulator transcription factor [Arcicella rigui]|uniref:LytTR family DNA-binding domain-containing protein n=1 Tax=Arcicella rigui TaxID=797020 RepID=A0ABU5QAN6_9BACT|nr:LytTR family DNA-binding domain-containing protein [Arcicella rigui]MEA5139911.1 LytTR family DNA-binding domain-containing protein [Arcicella rigui]